MNGELWCWDGGGGSGGGQMSDSSNGFGMLICLIKSLAFCGD